MAENIKGIEEGRAIFAYRCVESINDELDKDIAKYYKSYVKRIPAMIKNNGLGPAIAFIYSKGKDADKRDKKAYFNLYNHIESRLKEIELLEENDKLIETILEVDSLKYREITIEVLALFNWLRRIADGMIEGIIEGEAN